MVAQSIELFEALRCSFPGKLDSATLQSGTVAKVLNIEARTMLYMTFSTCIYTTY